MRARRRQSERECEKLKDELTHWRDCLLALPGFEEKHGRQLHALMQTLLDAVQTITQRSVLVPVTSANPTYRLCRQIDQCVFWVRSIWAYYRAKFDQRLAADPAALGAADEIVWACHAEAYERLTIAVPCMPLAFFEPRLSPRAILPIEPPSELRLMEADFLREFTRQLPLAVIGLPESCRNAPWNLAFAAHEVGHQVQNALGAVGAFRLALRSAAAGFGDQVADDWARWSEEIFADAYSLICLGPPATRLLAEVELEADSLGRPTNAYPSPLLRIRWQQAALAKWQIPLRDLGLLDAELSQVETTLNGDTRRDEARWLADFVAAAAFPIQSGTRARLAELATIDLAAFAVGGRIGKWAGDMRKGKTPEADGSKRAVREVTAAAIIAWSEVIEIPDDKQRSEDLAVLSAQVPAAIRALRPPGTRAGHVKQLAATDGHALALLLLQKSHPE